MNEAEIYVARVEQARKHFTEHFTRIGAVTADLALDEWEALDPEPGNSRWVLGFAAPLEHEGWVAKFCPELIAMTTMDLDDEMFVHYLTAATFVLDMEVAAMPVGGFISAEDRIAAADKATLEIADGSLRLLSEVHFAVLDSDG